MTAAWRMRTIIDWTYNICFSVFIKNNIIHESAPRLLLLVKVWTPVGNMQICSYDLDEGQFHYFTVENLVGVIKSTAEIIQSVAKS